MNDLKTLMNWYKLKSDIKRLNVAVEEVEGALANEDLQQLRSSMTKVVNLIDEAHELLD